MRFWLPLFLCFTLVLCLIPATGLLAAKEGDLPVLKSGLVEKAPGGEIDWGKEMFYAVGECAVPTASEVPNRTTALLKANKNAKMDAIASMRMLIAGTSISYSATGKDYMVNDATLTQMIEGCVKNVVVLRTEKIKQGKGMTIKVTVRCPMYGYQGPGAALLAKSSHVAREAGAEIVEAETEKAMQTMETKTAAVENADSQSVTIEINGKSTVVEPPPLSVTSVEETPAETKAVAETPFETAETETKAAETTAAETKTEVATATAVETPVEKASEPAKSVVVYTSVVVNTLGLNVMRAMSPKIRTEGGAEVYGTMQISPEEVQEHGPVAYVRTMVDAKKCPRAGANPLVIKAVGRAGGRRMCDVVLSEEDVAKLRSADAAAKPGFLKVMNVVFIVDPLKL